MERLILTYTVGDGYTYSAQETVPIVYKSKQDAIDDFVLLLLEYKDKVTEYDKKDNLLSEKNTKLFEKYATLLSKKKNKTDKDVQEAFEKHKAAQKELTTHQNSFSHSFNFGGTKFEYRNFVELSDGEYYVSEPQIVSLNEYFKNAEEQYNVDNVSNNSTKIKI